MKIVRDNGNLIELLPKEYVLVVHSEVRNFAFSYWGHGNFDVFPTIENMGEQEYRKGSRCFTIFYNKRDKISKLSLHGGFEE